MFDDVPDVHRRESLGSVGVGPRGGDFHRSMILGWELGGLMMVYWLTWLMYYLWRLLVAAGCHRYFRFSSSIF